MKKLSIVLTILLFTAGILSGCGQTTEQPDTDDTTGIISTSTAFTQSNNSSTDTLYNTITTVTPDAQLHIESNPVEGKQELTVAIIAKGASLKSAFQDYLSQVKGIIKTCRQVPGADFYDKIHLIYSQDSEYTSLPPLTSFDLTLSPADGEYYLDKISIDRSTSLIDNVEAWYLEPDESIGTVFKTVYTLLRTEGIYQMSR